MIVALRIMAAAAAATVLVAGWLWSWIAPSESPLALGDVLANTAQAETLHLQITRNGKTSQLWVRRPHELRWDEGGGRYRIAKGPTLWNVDEAANRAASQPSPYFHPQTPGLDLLALLDLPGDSRPEALLGARPVERVQRGGRACDLYQVEWPTPHGAVRIEALADGGTRWLHSLEAMALTIEARQPIGKLVVLGVNEPVDERLFVVSQTLTEDGRIGKVTDVQGIVSLKPMMHERWTPVDRWLVVKPGDWLRTDPRGANAVRVRLVPGTDLTLGPGSLVELIKPDRVRVLSGEVKIAGAKPPLRLLGPRRQETSVEEEIAVEGTGLYRFRPEGPVPLENEPLWLRGFEGATANESIGSLVASVEGRNVPLSVGYHKVSVDIRDQIARTEIEESFLNHTAGRLEGVFYFPLPEDASISGFGMWIGDELVEAEVVEKQRAREIYETILREKRDPGLLEWSGGSVFKARVFPIEPRSEKRIKITYTQVLPLRGGSFRYSYPLRSEMLRQHPLRELSIAVRLSSAAVLNSVASPTHTCRIRSTRHSAQVEFAAQEYTPTRDFEVVAEVAPGQSPVVLIPHRRGGDGYFMLQVTPPVESGQFDRPLLPDGKPIELLILADTSASLDAEARRQQAEFVAVVLSSLGPKDTFNLATCDVDCRWLFEKPRPADAETTASARELLADRPSLGWTDLGKAFASAIERAGPQTQVVYVGDGVVTGVAQASGLAADVGGTPSPTVAADPAAFAQRLRLLGQGKPGTFHAVGVGSSVEPLVLAAIASLGGGSVRRITGQRGPQAIARELLEEIVRPGLRNLAVEFRGIRTARVYPERLPNLPAGSQQILLGRYLPEGRDQSGEVVVTGLQVAQASSLATEVARSSSLATEDTGKMPVPFRFASPISLKDAEQGNSFIPRLWARMHLDSLLQQGDSQQIRDEVIALSEEYHIITPYTSLLVLETDEDRERFQVKPRFRMRDAEKFFAEGHERVDFDLMQQQMKLAGDWRTGLRRAVLAQLAALGRYSQMFAPQPYPDYSGRRLGGLGGESYGWYGLGLGPRAGPMPAAYSADGSSRTSLGFWAGLDSVFGPLDSEELGIELVGKEDMALEELALEDALDGEARYKVEKQVFATEEKPLIRLWSLAVVSNAGLDMAYGSHAAFFAFDELAGMGGGGFGGGFGLGHRRGISAKGSAYLAYEVAGIFTPEQQQPARYTQWLGTLVPHLPPPPAEEKPWQPKEPWPDEARSVAQSLLRTEQLAALVGGLEIDRQTESFEPRSGELVARQRTLSLVSPRAWLIRSEGDRAQTLVHWCDDGERGVFSKAFLLGRRRVSTPRDLRQPPLELSGHVLVPLDRSYQGYAARVEPEGRERVVLVLSHPTNPEYELRITVDTRRHVLLRIETRQQGKVTSASTLGDFVEVAGAWWAGRIESTDKKGRTTSVITQRFAPLEAEPLRQRIQAELAESDRVQFLREPLSKVADAKQALSAGKAGFDEQTALLLHFAQSQQWSRVNQHLERLEELAPNKPGLRWLRYAILDVSRRREELRGRLLEEAGRLAAGKAADAPASEDLFLADYLLRQAAGFLSPIEMLPLVETLKPVYQRQPSHQRAMKDWSVRRADLLVQASRTEEAISIRKQLAEQYPHEADLQGGYAEALINKGEYEAAKACIDRALKADFEWHEHEEEMLTGVWADALRREGRYAELVDFLAGRMQKNPEGQSVYDQYLSALVFADREEEANTLAARWIEEARTPQKLAPDAAARLESAVSLALGQGYNLWSDRVEERWLEPLAETVLFYARHPQRLPTADRIMRDYRFQRSDQCRRVRRQIAQVLLAEIDTLAPEQIDRFVDWIMPNEPPVEEAAWKRIVAGIQRRWSAQVKLELKDRLAGPLVRILAAHATAEEHLEFLRLQLQEGPRQSRAACAGRLFDALLAQPWSAQYEDEAFGLLEQLSDAEEAPARLVAQVAALHRLTDAMVQARFVAEMKKLEHQERLTRIELRQKQTDNLRRARGDSADRLRREAGGREKPLADWMTAEQLYLDTLAGRNLAAVAEACWEFLGPEPGRAVRGSADPAHETEHDIQRQLQAALENRFLTTLLNLAARRSASPALVERVLAYLDRGLAADPDDARWKVFTCQLLVALDRPKDLEKRLRAWTGSGDADNRWRRSLGYLLAEQGQIAEATTLFEAIRADDELYPDDYRALAGWYMAAGRRQEHGQALVDVYKTSEEWQMSSWLAAQLSSWERHDARPPSELDPEVLRVFAAIFAKSAQPQQYLDQLRRFYQATRDFRLLASLAEAVLGHSAAKVYPFLQETSGLLFEIQDEATADSLLDRIAEIRKRAKTPVDQRALDLLEALVERRAAEVRNQPGPHVEKARAAFQRAFQREWAEGEPRLVADLLAGLEAISQPELAEEQIRELEVLYQRETPGTSDRLHIGYCLARATWYAGRWDQAIDLLEAALAEFRAASGGVLPAEANPALSALITYLEGQGHHARGENALLAALERPANRRQQLWLTERLYELYDHAVWADGRVSLGSGLELYRAVEEKLRRELDTDDHSHRSNLVGRLMSLYRSAHGKKLPGVADDFRAFAFQRLPEVLKRQTNNYQQVVEEAAETLHQLAGPRDGVAFLVERIETEPGWLRYRHEEGWSRYGWRLAQWRVEAKQLDAETQSRLLAIVLAELRRDLESRQSRNRAMYSRHDTYYWAEKEGDFRRTAEEVLADRKQSGPAVQYIADYLYHGLEHYDRAIEVLFAAHSQGVLEEAGQAQLVRFLHERRRFGESIGVLQTLVERRPDNMQYRVWLMHAYFRTQQRDELLALLDATDACFHENDRWQEPAMAALAESCLENELFERSVGYFNEVIPLHQRTQPRRGIGGETLSAYYRGLARAYAGLGRTAEAVDAAAGAIVAWGPRHQRRAEALETLKQVLRDAKDLDGCVARLDKEAAEAGQDKPIVRKAIGQVYLEKRQFDKALAQLRLACQLEPNDAETHEALVACCDQQGDAAAAVRQVLDWLQLDRRAIERYRDLGQRLQRLERPEEAERAFTSIVEMLPNESESHALLAEVRQEQNRWPEAIALWERVAQIRSLEPTGLVKLAAAQVHEGRWDDAARTLSRLRSRSWPPRFASVEAEIRDLQRQIDRRQR